MRTWKPETAAAFGGAIGLSLAVGLGTGYLAADRPFIRAPHECTVMASTATEIFGLWGELTTAVNDRGDALDPKTYRIHDAEVNHLDASLDAVEVEYIDAENACLGEGK